MGKPPGGDDERRDEATVEAAKVDPDRAAILARRQRFIALALSGLATAACDKPNDDSATPKDGKAVQGGQGDAGARPQPCLDVAPVAGDGAGEGSTGKPMPCLDVAPPEPLPDDVAPSEPLPDDPAPPQACLKVAPPPEPKPQACLKVAPPPEPKPQACLRVAPPPEPEPKPQPCLKVAPPPEPKPMPRPCLNVAPPRDREPDEE